jgi:hypothetical protein
VKRIKKEPVCVTMVLTIATENPPELSVALKAKGALTPPKGDLRHPLATETPGSPSTAAMSFTKIVNGGTTLPSSMTS